MKTCRMCHQTKPLDDFPRHAQTKDKRGPYCKLCMKDYQRQWREKQPQKEKPPVNVPNTTCLFCSIMFHVKPSKLLSGRGKYCCKSHQFRHAREQTKARVEKRCPRCCTIKPLDLFNKNKSSPDGYSGICKDCIRVENKRQWNRDVVVSRQKDKESKKRALATEAGRRRISAQRSRNKCLRRIRMKDIPCEDIALEDIYLRDGGRCQICGKKTLPPHEGKVTDPRRASLDHIVPVSHPDFAHIGHVRHNVQLAHIGCNASRGAGKIAAQLRLIG